MIETLVTFKVDGVEYSFWLGDERPDFELDPTINMYRGMEEEPVATIHLNPRAPCVDPTHVILPPPNVEHEESHGRQPIHA